MMRTMCRVQQNGQETKEETDMKQEYQKPEVDIIVFDGRDIITESDGNIANPCWADDPMI